MIICEYEEQKKVDAKEAAEANTKTTGATPLERNLAKGNRSARAQTMVSDEFAK